MIAFQNRLDRKKHSENKLFYRDEDIFNIRKNENE